MKRLKIEVVTNEGKIATAIRTIGYDDNIMSDQLELLGIVENTKNIINERIKKLGEVRSNTNNDWAIYIWRKGFN